MKKKLVIVACVLVLGTLAIVLYGAFVRKPFAKLSASEVVSAELFIIPLDATVKP